MKVYHVLSGAFAALVLTAGVALAGGCNCGGGSCGSGGCSVDTCGAPQAMTHNPGAMKLAAAAESAQPVVKAVNVGNKVCPVSGQKIGSMGEGVKHEYNGKIYNFCCGGCIDPFKKDPVKYTAVVEKELKESAIK